MILSVLLRVSYVVHVEGVTPEWPVKSRLKKTVEMGNDVSKASYVQNSCIETLASFLAAMIPLLQPLPFTLISKYLDFSVTGSRKKESTPCDIRRSNNTTGCSSMEAEELR